MNLLAHNCPSPYVFRTWCRIILVRFPHPDVIGFTIKLRLACVYAFVTCSTNARFFFALLQTVMRQSKTIRHVRDTENAFAVPQQKSIIMCGMSLSSSLPHNIAMLARSLEQQVLWNMTFYQSKNYLFAPSIVVSNVNTSKES